jgi:hypothetical protein
MPRGPLLSTSDVNTQVGAPQQASLPCVTQFGPCNHPRIKWRLGRAERCVGDVPPLDNALAPWGARWAERGRLKDVAAQFFRCIVEYYGRSHYEAVKSWSWGQQGSSAPLQAPLTRNGKGVTSGQPLANPGALGGRDGCRCVVGVAQDTWCASAPPTLSGWQMAVTPWPLWREASWARVRGPPAGERVVTRAGVHCDTPGTGLHRCAATARRAALRNGMYPTDADVCVHHDHVWRAVQPTRPSSCHQRSMGDVPHRSCTPPPQNCQWGVMSAAPTTHPHTLPGRWTFWRLTSSSCHTRHAQRGLVTQRTAAA